jgi:hypothetical protein
LSDTVETKLFIVVARGLHRTARPTISLILLGLLS